MAENFDCIIVGAGPAGSLAAKTLAESGAEVLLLEKHPRIGEPLACAEAISFSGLSRMVTPDPEWINTRIHRALLVSPSHKELLLRHPDAGFVLNRRIFETRLAEQASSRGACIRLNSCAVGLLNGKRDGFCGVKVSENGAIKEYGAKVIIGADGVESWVARWAGMDSSVPLGRMESCAQYRLGDVDVEPDRLEFHLGRSLAPGGYAWVFPKGKDKANVGLAVTPDLAGRNAQEFLDEFVKKRFPQYRILESHMGGVPCYDKNLSLVKKNVLLVGDAGRLVDSLSGAGIANALLSGRIAGEVVSRFLKNGKPSFAGLKKYEDRFMKEKGGELRFYSYCRAIFLKMTDEDMDDVVSFLKDYFGDRSITSIQPISLVKTILQSNRRLLRLLRHLVW
jgi:digeranylgeranylglycerophospholipid reductase